MKTNKLENITKYILLYFIQENYYAINKVTKKTQHEKRVKMGNAIVVVFVDWLCVKWSKWYFTNALNILEKQLCRRSYFDSFKANTGCAIHCWTKKTLRKKLLWSVKDHDLWNKNTEMDPVSASKNTPHHRVLNFTPITTLNLLISLRKSSAAAAHGLLVHSLMTNAMILWASSLQAASHCPF